ncbi:MAG TPA: hypothetical protein DDX39_12135 [Bacteroidales bacterium]|nr:MAG: hypothetical protein A2W98_11540 [Bacteroidetes bacterium GWF2_33_38]OFY74868.1 MAG: hypothetical protein A2265_04115 [Bacteroidetes bacterium RIFOXYA12_FULL_33_9]OFY92073.1 MAG: hypothetical protein A2236_08950 [Bacteroidetes bacterium RIFOXYA2_FULL_33_7]HBF89381.1 hypothetical protein [Bacteroidales bacterium]
MIKQNNYISHIERLGFENLPDELKQAHLVIMTKTNNGRNWKACEKDKELKELVNLAFQKLQEFISSKGKQSLNGYFTPRTAAIDFIKPYINNGDTMSLHPNLKLKIKTEDYSAHIEGDNVVVSSIYGEPIQEVFTVKELMDEIVRGISEKKSKPKVEKKEKKPDCIEVKFFRLMLYWNNKIVTKSMLAKQIEDLQSNILNKRIRKTSPFAEEIAYLQESLVEIHNTMTIHYLRFKLKDETVQSLKQAIKKFAQMDYFNTDEENKNTVDLSGISSLESEVNDSEAQEAIQGNDNNEGEVGQVMNSVDFSKLEFNSIGLKDKWLKLIGDPAPGFSAMVFGKPKMGKSYLCVDFAGYLARNHGTVLYVAREEKLDATLQKKLKEKDVAHPNLFVSDYLPEDLSAYKFVFIDSVNKLGLSPQDIENLRRSNQGKSFIFVFQTTKEGNFRGTNEFQHDVDVVIEVPEKGKAVQFGRFNQGGEMNIFENTDSNVVGLSGIAKKARTTGKEISISTELGIPLEELAIDLLNENQDKSEIINVVYKQTAKVEKAVLAMVKNEIKEQKLNIAVEKVTFTENDRDNISTGASYFEVVLKGNKTDLKKIAGEDKLFIYDWSQELNGNTNNNLRFRKKSFMLAGIKNSKMETKKYPSWTSPHYLDNKDHEDLKKVYDLYKAGNKKEAFKLASDFDTIVRESIPAKVWQEMGGKIIPKSKTKSTDLSKYSERSDDYNPSYIFRLAATQLLCESLKGDFDIMYLIRRELANRGVDKDGKWVGFPEAKKVHGVE